MLTCHLCGAARTLAPHTCRPRSDTPTSPEPGAAPPVDTEPWTDADMRALRNASDWASSDLYADIAERAADELDAHRARHAALVALVAGWRASGEAATENAGLRAVMLARADELARILGEQP